MTRSADDDAYERVFSLSLIVDCTNHCMLEDKSGPAFTFRVAVTDLLYQVLHAFGLRRNPLVVSIARFTRYENST
jgi:hypothetical protein